MWLAETLSTLRPRRDGFPRSTARPSDADRARQTRDLRAGEPRSNRRAQRRSIGRITLSREFCGLAGRLGTLRQINRPTSSNQKWEGMMPKQPGTSPASGLQTIDRDRAAIRCSPLSSQVGQRSAGNLLDVRNKASIFHSGNKGRAHRTLLPRPCDPDTTFRGRRDHSPI